MAPAPSPKSATPTRIVFSNVFCYTETSHASRAAHEVQQNSMSFGAESKPSGKVKITTRQPSFT
ncbi:hypothetical protein Patl1_36113 [Pistacia atlantica]|nr:hypothetical protein Patl1_36113 [Pistacia atlantica]